MEILQTVCSDRSGTHVYSVRLLHELGQGELTTKKIAELWQLSAKHDVLFSDYTRGDPEAFVRVLLDPRGVWFEVARLPDEEVVGALYLSDIIPNFDAKGHFTFWDSNAKGRERIIWLTMKWVMDRYSLHRISAEIPVYQAGVLRFTRRLGFKEEGERREGVFHKSKWLPMIQFGMLRSELEEVLASDATPPPPPREGSEDVGHAIWEGRDEVDDSDGDEGSYVGSGSDAIEPAISREPGQLGSS